VKTPILPLVDHLVYATPNLDAAIVDLERRLGVRATPGGSHPGRGTRNALIAIGAAAYLEIVGPDPDQVVDGPRWFGIDGLSAPRLVTWAAKGRALHEIVERAAGEGVRLGPAVAGRRVRSDGIALFWTCTDPTVLLHDGLVPFFIDWGDSPHPSTSAAPGPRLSALRAQHPDPSRVRASLAVLGLDLQVDASPRAALVATLQTEQGPVELS
jgi:hypothetical protein